MRAIVGLRRRTEMSSRNAWIRSNVWILFSFGGLKLKLRTHILDRYHVVLRPIPSRLVFEGAASCRDGENCRRSKPARKQTYKQASKRDSQDKRVQRGAIHDELVGGKFSKMTRKIENNGGNKKQTDRALLPPILAISSGTKTKISIRTFPFWFSSLYIDIIIRYVRTSRRLRADLSSSEGRTDGWRDVWMKI